MPRRIRRRKAGEGGKAFKIVEPGGKVVGESDTAAKAGASAGHANKATKKPSRARVRNKRKR